MTQPETPEPQEFRRLIALLATGGRLPIIDLDDWEFCLREISDGASSATGRWFLRALAAEWVNAEPPSPYCKQIEDSLRDYIETRTGAWSAWWGHSLRVAGLMCWLAPQVDVDPEEAYLTGLFHDIHKLDERALHKPHPALGAQRALRDLDGSISKAAVMRIVEAIAIHPDRPPSSWKLACVLHDADKLDKVGATGLLRRVSEQCELPDACRAAMRSIRDLASLPNLCYTQMDPLYERKREFTRAVDRLLREACR